LLWLLIQYTTEGNKENMEKSLATREQKRRRKETRKSPFKTSKRTNQTKFQLTFRTKTNPQSFTSGFNEQRLKNARKRMKATKGETEQDKAKMDVYFDSHFFLEPDYPEPKAMAPSIKSLRKNTAEFTVVKSSGLKNPRQIGKAERELLCIIVRALRPTMDVLNQKKDEIHDLSGQWPNQKKVVPPPTVDKFERNLFLKQLERKSRRGRGRGGRGRRGRGRGRGFRGRGRGRRGGRHLRRFRGRSGGRNRSRDFSRKSRNRNSRRGDRRRRKSPSPSRRYKRRRSCKTSPTPRKRDTSSSRKRYFRRRSFSCSTSNSRLRDVSGCRD